MSLMKCADDFGLRRETGRELLEQEETSPGAAEGKWKSGALGLEERFEVQNENRGHCTVIRVRARNALN